MLRKNNNVWATETSIIDGYADEYHYCLFDTKIYCTYFIEKLQLDFSLK
jgi:hypothetical protein